VEIEHIGKCVAALFSRRQVMIDLIDAVGGEAADVVRQAGYQMVRPGHFPASLLTVTGTTDDGVAGHQRGEFLFGKLSGGLRARRQNE
jgi:hypothetical protein